MCIFLQRKIKMASGISGFTCFHDDAVTGTTLAGNEIQCNIHFSVQTIIILSASMTQIIALRPVFARKRAYGCEYRDMRS